MSDGAWKLMFKLITQVVRADLSFETRAQLLRFKAEQHLADTDLESFGALIDQIREVDTGIDGRIE